MKPVALALVAALLLSACQTGGPATSQAVVTPQLSGSPSPAPAEFKLYDGSADGFTLEHPADWTVRPKGTDGNLVPYAVMLSKAYPPSTTLVLSVVLMPAGSVGDPSKICEGPKEVLRSDLYTPMNQEVMTVNGVEICEVWGTGLLGRKKRHLYTFVRPRAGFIMVDYTNTLEHADRIKAELGRLVSSFKLVG